VFESPEHVAKLCQHQAVGRWGEDHLVCAGGVVIGAAAHKFVPCLTSHLNRSSMTDKTYLDRHPSSRRRLGAHLRAANSMASATTMRSLRTRGVTSQTWSSRTAKRGSLLPLVAGKPPAVIPPSACLSIALLRRHYSLTGISWGDTYRWDGALPTFQ
jgi:hypothetical protein